MKQRKIGLVTCTSLVVANMIGTGVFTGLGFQVGGLPSGFVILCLWALGAALAMCGALCYAELAAALPRSGGEYHFLSRIYHPSLGFMAGLVSVLVGFAAPVALAARAFGEYLSGALPVIEPVTAAVVIVTVVTGAHLLTLGYSRVFQNVFTTLKLTLILAFIVCGFALAAPQPVNFLPAAGDGALLFSQPFAVSLMFVMYAYSGWNASTYLIDEVRNAVWNVPWSLIIGSLLVGVLYVLLNAVFLHSAPMGELEDKIDVGAVAGVHIFGAAGGRIMSGLIALGLISAISAMTWAGPRVTQTIGEDIRLLRFLAWKTPAGIPLIATLFQYVLVLVMILKPTFEALLLFAQFLLTLCVLLAVVGVIVLRVRQPALARPFRCWGYPATPLLFAAISSFMLVYSAMRKPMEALASGAVLAGGIGIYFAARWVGARREKAR
jgi:APA family basic amino acid/polyamine antiporter